MERSYWTRRTREASREAYRTTSAEARLIHFELAGRYSLMAAAAAPANDVADDCETLSYAQLEEGARYLAAKAHDEVERARHLAQARLYKARAEHGPAKPALVFN
jgi:hypothetical protein